MIVKKKKSFDRVKTLKKISREENPVYGRSGAGAHKNRGDKRQREPSTREFLEEMDEELDGY